MSVHYEYKVVPRSAGLGGGWRLQLFEDGVEVGGGVFPLPWENEPAQGIAWWNDMTEEFRLEWLIVAGSAVPADAWRAYLTNEAEGDAVAEGESWLSTRPANDD